MGAILGGTMRSPFTGIVFALELTHDINMLLPLLVAVTIAHGFTVLLLQRSILTEKVARRGFHLSREYAVDPLEILFVREVMQRGVAWTTPPIEPASVIPDDLPFVYVDEPLRMVVQRMAETGVTRFPVVTRGAAKKLLGVIALNDLLQARVRNLEAERRRERVLRVRLPFVTPRE